MTDTELTAALGVARQAALAAGTLLRAELHLSGGPRGDRHKAPADLEAEDLIRERLTSAFPSWGFRGEERPTASRAAAAGGPVWLVDPNDGTSPFHQCIRGSAVSIGLVQGGVPVLGVVYAYAAPDDDGDLFEWAEGCGPLRRNGVPVRAALPPVLEGRHTVLVSHRADLRSRPNALLCAPARYRAVPSIAYRLALVAAGEAAATSSLGGPQDFDLAGGHAILRGAGGELVDGHGQPVRYDERRATGVVSCFGGHPVVARELAGRGWAAALGQTVDDPPDQWPLSEAVRGQLVGDAGLLSRAQGCLLGLVAGDALGGLVEFQRAEVIAAEWGDGPRDLVDGGHWGTLGGQPTDDSELALVLARSLVANGWDEEAIARAYAWWFASNPYDVGGTTAGALGPAVTAAAEQRSAAEAARRAASSTSQANGGLMRVAPLGVFASRLQPSCSVGLARAEASLTHPHPVCRDASALFVALIALAIEGAPSPAELYAVAREVARTEGLHPDIVETVEAAATAPPPEYHRQMGWVRIALQNALWQLRTAPSLEAALVDTVRRGGDTDTNAAIAGGLLGACLGREAVPPRWRDRVLSCRPIAGLRGVRYPRPKPLWPVDLLTLAERLLVAGERHATRTARACEALTGT